MNVFSVSNSNQFIVRNTCTRQVQKRKLKLMSYIALRSREIRVIFANIYAKIFSEEINGTIEGQKQNWPIKKYTGKNLTFQCNTLFCPKIDFWFKHLFVSQSMFLHKHRSCQTSHTEKINPKDSLQNLHPVSCLCQREILLSERLSLSDFSELATNIFYRLSSCQLIKKKQSVTLVD